MANGELLKELRAMAAGPVDDLTYRRMMLAAMADLYESIDNLAEKIEAWEEHTHPEIDDLKNRDWKVIITAAVVGLFSVAAAWLSK